MVYFRGLSLCQLVTWISLNTVLQVAGQFDDLNSETLPSSLDPSSIRVDPTSQIENHEVVVVMDGDFNEELVVDKGSNFTLSCRSGFFSISWAFPEYIPYENENRSIPVISYGHEDGQYISNLTMTHAYFMDTGYFTCYDTETNFHDVARVYVYVRDKDNLLAINSTASYIHKIQGDTVEFPCRPTDPTLEVKLMKDSMIFEEATYDPHIGFTFVVESILQTGVYECVVGDNYCTTYHLVIVLKQKTSSIEKPHIEVSHIVATVGDNVTFACSVHHDIDVYVDLYWRRPKTSPNKTGHIVMDDKETSEVNGRNKKMVYLKINSVQKEDAGDYICEVTDHADNINSNKTNLMITESNMLELMPEKWDVTRYIGVVSVELLVKILSLPHVKYRQWYDNNNNPIRTGSSEYTMIDDNFKSKLTINSPNIRDSGNYTLAVNNGIIKKNISIAVRFLGTPEVIMNQKEKENFYLVGKEHRIHCEVYGHPRPSITWYVTLCPHYPQCDSQRTSVPEDQYEQDEQVPPLNMPLKSTLIVPRDQKTANFSCVANNHLSFFDANGIEILPENHTIFLATDVNGGFALEHPSLVVTTDNITLSCGASKYKYMQELQWLLLKNGRETEIPQDNMWNDESDYSFLKKLNIPDVSRENAGTYICRATDKETNSIKDKSYNMSVFDLVQPRLSREDSDAKQTGKTGDKVKFHCKVEEGIPPPVVVWFKKTEMGELVPVLELEKRCIPSKDNQTLTVTLGLDNDGIYVCRATNKAAAKELEFEVILTDKPSKGRLLLLMYVMIVVVVLAVLLSLWYAWRAYKLRKQYQVMKEAGLHNFEKGNIESLNPDLDVGDQADLLPYDRKKWEFPQDKLKLEKQLGSGAFGVVFKAQAYELMEPGVATTVAVKMVKRNSDVATIRALASELKIMIHLGKHLNIVNVLGACTGDLNKRELKVLVEYCEYGNLHNYLLMHRGAFVNQVNPRTGLFDPSVIQPMSPRSPSGNFPDNPFGPGDVSNGMSIRTSAALSHATDTTLIMSDMSTQSKTEADVQSTPIGEDGYLICRDHEWRNKDRGDSQAGLGPVCTQDLICWSYQIARGMEYLANRKVFHGDLAARNILLASDNIVKICDFGFSKITDLYYHKKGDGPLPVKWMALESIQDKKFSIQSDVWAYGITLWELFSLACTPYPGMEVGENLFYKLANGYRMEQPKYATKQVYQVMTDCWHLNPHTRPSFTELAERFGGMLEETVRAHYVDLNDPFLQENSELLAQCDYLSMLRSPSYSNWTPNGYSVMKPYSDTDEAMEMAPMLNTTAVPSPPDSPDDSPTITKPSGNNYVNVAQVMGFSNPNYHNMGRPKQNPYKNISVSADES